jgi:hypothetical protein
MNYKLRQLVIIILLLAPSATYAMELTNKRITDYFKEVVYGSEYSENIAVVRRWTSNINVYTVGAAPEYLIMELDEILDELNDLIKPLKIKRVNSHDKANLTLFLGRGDEYIRIEPRAKTHVIHNYGLFWVDWDKNNSLVKGSVYVDIYRAKSPRLQKHLLREELTQALGIMRDSYTYKDSIFYQKNSLVTSYSELDKAVIKRLYSPKIKPGHKK